MQPGDLMCRLRGSSRRRGAATAASFLAALVPALVLATTTTETARFNDFLNDIYQRDIHDSPMLAATFGAKDGFDRWDDLSAAAEQARIGVIRADMRSAKTRFDYSKLDDRGKLQYRVFLYEDNLLLQRYRWRDHFYPMNQIVGLHLTVPDILVHQNTIKDTADADAYIGRIVRAKVLFDQFILQIKQREAKGFLMPKLVYPLLIEQCRGVIAGAPYDSGPDNPIWADFNRKIAALEIPAADKESLRDRARAAMLQSLEPAYRELVTVLEEQQAKSRIEGGVWQQPDGDAFYAFLVRQFTTTTDMTPRRIHELGLHEVARLHGEMQAVMNRVGFQGTLRQFMAQMKADPKFYYADSDEGREAFLDRARAIIDAMKARITNDFLAPPALPLVIKRPEAYREASLPAGDYEARFARREDTGYDLSQSFRHAKNADL